MRNIWALRLTTFTLWLLAAASLSYWLLQTTARAQTLPALATAQVAGAPSSRIAPDPALVAQGLGAVGSAPERSSASAGSASGNWNSARFKLFGILAQGSAQDGLIMLSVDGKPVQILRLGSTVEPGVVVQALTRQSITLANTNKANAGQTFTLTLGQANGNNNGTSAGNAGTPRNSNPSAQNLNAALGNNENSNTDGTAIMPPIAAPIPASVVPPPAQMTGRNFRRSAENLSASANAAPAPMQAPVAQAPSVTQAPAPSAAPITHAAASTSTPPTPAPRHNSFGDDSLYFRD